MTDAELTQIARDAAAQAAAHLADTSADIGKRVHDARRRIKQVRAILGLGHDALDGDFDAISGAFRDAARALAPVREHDALAAMAGSLRDWTHDPLERRALSRVEHAIGPRPAIEIAAPVFPLITFTARKKRWLERGLRRSRRAERRAFREARDARTAEAIHEWRKRVKDLWYQMQLVDPPAGALHDLSRLLGKLCTSSQG